jgi:acetoin utilization deacetylase AcuC-like enzyme
VNNTESRRVGLVFDDRYLTHNTGLALIEDVEPFPFADPVPHVSSPALIGRAKHLMDLAGITDAMVHVDAYEAPDDALLAYHTREYLDRVREIARAGGDTGQGAPIGRSGDRVARLAAGGAMAAVDAVMTNAVQAAYALVRPPGHHAMADAGMGFCIYNNAVIAAHHAQRGHNAGKVLILDWDVHHGNGTQAAFYADPSVLFISLHQDDLYPVGWGAIDQQGEGAGKGFTINIPLPPGTGNRGYIEAFDRIVIPVTRQFEPDLILVSAGQDASVVDPLARMALTTASYRDMMTLMVAVAAEVSNGRVVVTQEGGYAPQYAPYCSTAIAEALVGACPGITPHPDPYGPRATSMLGANELGLDAERAIQAAIAAHGEYWSLSSIVKPPFFSFAKLLKKAKPNG